ncbi:MAG: hypothetical protein K0Q43_1840 [Ramlibacter sp.]|nr:hypothetical protein [Ramlibacter sp.]
MNRNLATALTFVSTGAAALALAAIASGNAYADDITIDSTPFVSSRTRAEVQAEVMGQGEALRMASSEWGTQLNTTLPQSTVTRAQVRQEYIATRNEVNALNSEDSGSSYLASLPRRGGGLIMAGSER